MDETALFMDETAHFMDENVTFQSYGSKGHFMDETAKLMKKKNTSPATGHLQAQAWDHDADECHSGRPRAQLLPSTAAIVIRLLLTSA